MPGSKFALVYISRRVTITSHGKSMPHSCFPPRLCCSVKYPRALISLQLKNIRAFYQKREFGNFKVEGHLLKRTIPEK